MNHGVPRTAPANIVREDFRDLSSRILLRTAWPVEELVLMQSVTSHAYMGHGLFRGLQFVDTTEDDVARAMRMAPDVVRSDRQALIDEIRDYAARAIAGKAGDTLANATGEPLLRIGTFRQLRADPKGVLQGLYLGGLRDEPETRSTAEKRYGVRIGWGKCCLVNKSVMRKMHLSGETLARQPHADELEGFRQAGLIVDRPGRDVAYMYVRHHVGPGASDDAAIVMAGKLYGLSAALGVFLADAVDTLEKYAARDADQDSEIAHYIAKAYPNLGLGPDDAARVAFLASAPEGRERDVPDSSLRGLLEVDRRHDLCALECHLLYAEGRSASEIDLDHGQSTTTQFYEYVEVRLAEEARM
jgi:hypothetical protein